MTDDVGRRSGPPKLPQTQTQAHHPATAPDGPPGVADVGGRLGGFRLVRELGRGGMGTVFEAEDSLLHRRVAVKVLHAGQADPSFGERFLREARAAAALRHDHVVTIYQVGQDGDTPFLVMEFLEGETLADRLEKRTWLPVPEAVRVAKEVAEGLAAAHAKGLIHRDVKPANIWLEAPEGPRQAPRLRPRPRRRGLDADGPRRGRRHPRVHGPGADLRRAARRPHRPVRPRLRALPDAVGPDAVPAAEHDGPPGRGRQSGRRRTWTPWPARCRPRSPRCSRQLLARNPDDRPAGAAETAAALQTIADGLNPAGKADPPDARTTQSRQRRTAGILVGVGIIVLAAVVGIAAMVQRLPHKPSADPRGAAGAAAGEPIRVGVVHSLSGRTRTASGRCTKPSSLRPTS